MTDKVEQRFKIWEQSPISFAVFRERVMAFCYQNNVAPDEIMIGPYTDSNAPCGTITEMGIVLIADKQE